MKTMNTQTTHTPGPWRIDGTHLVPDVSEVGPLPHSVIRDGGDRWVALVETTCAAGVANTRLIAASLSMLDALKDIAGLWEDSDQTNGLAEIMARAARAAIAKAGGKA